MLNLKLADRDVWVCLINGAKTVILFSWNGMPLGIGWWLTLSRRIFVKCVCQNMFD